MKAQSKTSARLMLAAERKAKALDLRIQNKTHREIAEELGVTPQAVSKMLKSALADLCAVSAERAEHVRQMELERLDKMAAGLRAQAELGNPKAVYASIAVMNRRSQLLGLDAPSKEQHEVFGKDGAPIGKFVIELVDSKGEDDGSGSS